MNKLLVLLAAAIARRIDFDAQIDGVGANLSGGAALRQARGLRSWLPAAAAKKWKST